MYFVKDDFIGSVVTMPLEAHKSCAKLSQHYMILNESSNQEALEFLYKYNHPGVGKIEKKAKDDNTKRDS